MGFEHDVMQGFIEQGFLQGDIWERDCYRDPPEADTVEGLTLSARRTPRETCGTAVNPHPSRRF
jgi:hypothetical protein